MKELFENLIQLANQEIEKCIEKKKAPSKRILSTLDKIILLNSLNQNPF